MSTYSYQASPTLRFAIWGYKEETGKVACIAVRDERFNTHFFDKSGAYTHSISVENCQNMVVNEARASERLYEAIGCFVDNNDFFLRCNRMDETERALFNQAVDILGCQKMITKRGKDRQLAQN